MLAHVPSFGRNPGGSPDFLAYPVPKACMHVLGTRVPRRLGVARSASSPKAAQALACSLTPGLRISFGRVTCMARAASVPGLWALGFLLLACVCGWVRVAVGRGFCLPLPVVAGVLGRCVWARFVVLSLFCRLFVVFVVGLWCRPAFEACVVPCAFPLPPAVSGSGVRCGRACSARVSAVPRPSWLGCPVVCFLRFFFFWFFFFRLLAVPVRGLVVSPPVSFLSGWAAGFFFFLSACFGAPFSRWAAVPGLVLPVLPGWSPCACLGVLSSLPSGWGVWPPSVLLAGGLVAVGCFRAPRRPPLFFGGGGGAAWPFHPLPSLGWRLLCGWCVVWLVPRHSWRRFLCATARHSWLGFAAGGGGRSPPLLAGVCRRRWCVVRGGGVLVGLWLVCGVVGPSRLLAEVPVCYSPPLLAGFRCRWWWAVPATPGWGLPAAVVCGAWRWCVGGVVVGVWCGWSLATPGGGSCVLLSATPGWVSLPVVVGGPRHSWLGSVGGVAVWCVVCGGGVLVGLWLLCGVVGPSPLLAEVPVCYSPPLLAGFRCRWWWAVPATPGWGPLAAVVCGVWCVVCGVWRWCVGGVVAGVWCGWSLATPGRGSCVLLPATPGWVSLPLVVGGIRHSWVGSPCGGGVWCVVCGGGVLVGLWLVCGVVGPSPLLAEVPVCYPPPLLAGFRCRWWAVPTTPGWGPLAASVCGVLRWCVVGVVVGPSPLLAEVPVCYSPPLLAGFRCRWWWAVPATPGSGPLAAPVCGVWCVVGVPRHSWRRFLCATPRHSWLGFAAAGGGRSPPLLAGVRWRRWCACFAWPGRAGRPPGRVLVRLTFSFGRFVFLLCLAPSGLRLPLSLSLLLPFLVGCFSRPSAAWLAPRLCLPLGRWLLFGGCSPAPPPLFVSRFSSLLLVALVFFFSSSSSSVRPRCLQLSLVSGPGCPGPRRSRCLFCWPSASGLSVRLSLFRAFLLAVGCSRVVAAPPPPFVSRGFRSCRSVPCAVLCCASLGAVLPGVVLRSFGAAACCAVPSGAVRRPGALCSAALCSAVFPRAVCSVLCVFCRGAVVRAVVRRSALCCVCLGVLCCAFPVLSVLCGAVLRCAGALALCCSCVACCCWRLVLWCAAVCCAVSCGVPWCGAGSGGPWLSAGGVFRCRCPCLAAWSASLWLVWFAVAPCFPVSCSVVLCCRVVLCCCALLSCCGAVGACFALLWAVVLCCVVLLVGCAVFGPVVVSVCCGALLLALCVPCLLRSVRCGALLCWLWCPASLCRVLWRCAVVWCCAVVLCCRFAVLFVFALPSCGLSCGACVVCAVVGASCCGVSLCVVVSPWAFCGVVVLLWCVVVSCGAVRCPVVSCALCRVLRCRAALRCCAGWLCCAVVCAAGVCFVLFSFAKNPCRFSVPLKTFFFFKKKK